MKQSERFTVADALRPENQRRYIWAPVCLAVRQDNWRTVWARRAGLDVDDLRQELYISSIERLRSLPPDYEIGAAFIIRAAWNRFVDKYRSKHVRPVDAISIEETVKDSSDFNRAVDVIYTPEKHDGRDACDVVASISTIVFRTSSTENKARNAEIVRLRFCESLGIESIAERFNTTKAAVDKVCKRFRDYCTENYTKTEFYNVFLS